jgi:hypothetical protein
VTDRVANGEVQVKYCPTGNINGDYFTKPLQEAAFRKFWDRILNVTDSNLKKCIDDNRADEQLAGKLTHHRSVLDTNDTNMTKLGCVQQKEGQMDEWMHNHSYN